MAQTVQAEAQAPEVEQCACGRPLHYSDPAIEQRVRGMIGQAGSPCVPVHAGGRKYLVQRHYIALHGLKAEELPMLAARGIVTCVGGSVW